MHKVREIVEKVHAMRSENGLKVRQPLSKCKIQNVKFKMLDRELLDIIADEINVKKVELADIKDEIELDTNITPELRQEGLMREFVRQIQSLRKKSALTPQDKIVVTYQTENTDYQSAIQKFEKEIMAQTLAEKITKGDTEAEMSDLKDISLSINKI